MRHLLGVLISWLFSPLVVCGLVNKVHRHPPPLSPGKAIASSQDGGSLDSATKITRTYRILFPLPAVSLAFQQLALAEELAARGHDVLVMSQSKYARRAEKLSGVRVMDLGSGPNMSWYEGALQKSVDTNDIMMSMRMGARQYEMFQTDVVHAMSQIIPLRDRDEESDSVTEDSDGLGSMGFTTDGERPTSRMVETGRHDGVGRNGDRGKAKKRRVGRTFPVDEVKRPDLVVVAAPWLRSIRVLLQERGVPHVICNPCVLFGLVFTHWPYMPPAMSTVPYWGKNILGRIESLVSAIIVKSGFLWGDAKRLRGILAGLDNNVLHIVQTVPGLDFPLHSSQLIQYTGPFVSSSRQANHLSARVSTVMSVHQDVPIVYLSLGSIIINSLNTRTEAILRGLLGGEGNESESPKWHVMWSFSNASLVKSVPWLQQAVDAGRLTVEPWLESPAVLGHPNVKAFVSHCGTNGLHESLLLGTPVVCFPMFGDQPDNCARLGESGAGICVSRHSITVEKVRDAVAQVLLPNSHVKRRVEVIAATMRGLGGVSRAADLVEMAAAVKGDFSSWATVVEREGVVRSFCLDVLLATVIMLVVTALAVGVRVGSSRVKSTVAKKGKAARYRQ